MDSNMSGMNAAFVASAWTPIDFVVAVWLGMSHQDIVAGLADGRVIPPPGESAGWIPPAWAGEGFGTPSLAPGASDPATTGSNSSGTSGSGTGGSGDSDHDTPVRHFVLDHDHVAALYRQLDPTLSDAKFDALWNRAGPTDEIRAGSLFAYLRRALLGETDEQTSSDGAKVASAMHTQASQLTEFLSAANHHGTVVDLTGKDGAELFRLAKSDPGYRYALRQLDSFAVIGNRALMAIHDGNGELDRFDPDTGEANLSDAWLADRAKFLAWKMQTDAGGDAKSDSDGAWTFIDRSNPGADGKPLQLKITGKSDSAPQNQVIFGNDDPDGEMLKGSAATDRIYGGGGDDVLRGNAGDDHLEGGNGDDLVMGGVGNDELTGDQGDDELDGNSGVDRLDGGSGDDTLTGGRGDDRLVGGVGHDTYVIDPRDGSDTIIDSDGDGEVQFDGNVLVGATTLKNGKYVSDDGKTIFGFEGDSQEGGTLTVQFFDTAKPGEDATATNTVRIKAWQNGDLGIALGDGSPQALAALTADDLSTGMAPGVASSTPGVDQTSDSGDHGSGQDAGGTGIGSSDAADSGATANSADAELNMLVNTLASAEVGSDSAAQSSDAVASDSAAQSSDAVASDLVAAVEAPPDLHVNPSADGHEITDAMLDALLASSKRSAADNLLRPETVHAALAAFSPIAEPPDVVHTAAASSAASVGVTPYDIANAMLDFHDAQHDAAPIGNELMTASAGIGEMMTTAEPATNPIRTKANVQTSAGGGGSLQS
jgi:hypothetical protein